MDYIHKLPFILGAVVTITVGIISYSYKVSDQVLYMRMAVSMAVFYLLGLYVRSVIEKTLEEARQKKKEEELKKAQERKKKKKEEESKIDSQDKSSSQVDYKVGDDEEFSPLKVSEVIKDNLKE